MSSTRNALPAYLTKAIAIQGGASADLFNLRAASYDALNRIDEAFSDYDRAVKLSPNWSSPMLYRGRIYEKRGTSRLRSFISRVAQPVHLA